MPEELETHETVVIEREFDLEGRVIKETRTVSKPKRRELKPLTPLKTPAPFNPSGPPFTTQPYVDPWQVIPTSTPQVPNWGGGGSTPGQYTYGMNAPTLPPPCFPYN